MQTSTEVTLHTRQGRQKSPLHCHPFNCQYRKLFQFLDFPRPVKQDSHSSYSSSCQILIEGDNSVLTWQSLISGQFSSCLPTRASLPFPEVRIRKKTNRLVYASLHPPTMRDNLQGTGSSVEMECQSRLG